MTNIKINKTMSAVDNTNKIKKLLKFDDEQVFYFVQIIKRKKDQKPNDKEKIKDNYIIQDIFIHSMNDFNKKVERIKPLCDFYNARAYFRLNRCYYDKVAFEVMSLTAEYLQKDNAKNVKSVYATACGRKCYDKEKTWIIDIDEEQLNEKDDIIETIKKCNSSYDEKIVDEIPTKSGLHLISYPFDLFTFKYDQPKVDVHKNNPTILYIPE